MDFRTESLVSLAAAVRSRTIAARELVGHALERIEALDGQVNAFCAVDGERALAEAAALDERLARAGGDGSDGPALAGIPFGVKDLEDVEGFVTTYGSPYKWWVLAFLIPLGWLAARLFRGDPVKGALVGHTGTEGVPK